MTTTNTISADYTLRPSELASTLALLVEARQPAMVWGPPGSAKSMIAQQVAADGGREYVDVRALLLDPVDLRGIPWRDATDRTRWAPPVFLPPTDGTGLWLINLEELPSCVPMVQAALYQLALERKVGEYELPEGASLIACGSLAAVLRCIPVIDQAARTPFKRSSCCCCACGDVGKARSGLSIISTGGSPRYASAGVRPSSAKCGLTRL